MTNSVLALFLAVAVGMAVTSFIVRQAGAILRIGSTILLLWLAAKQLHITSLGDALDLTTSLRLQVVEWFANHSRALDGFKIFLSGGGQ